MSEEEKIIALLEALVVAAEDKATRDRVRRWNNARPQFSNAVNDVLNAVDANEYSAARTGV